MKWCLFLFSFSLLAADIPLGDIIIHIPDSQTHQQIGKQTQQFSIMESTTPATNRLIYLSAPNALAEKSNNNEVVNLDDYHVIQSFRQVEFVELTLEVFNANKQAMLDGISKALKSTSISDLENEINQNLLEQQGSKAEFKLGNPRLIGEPQITDRWFRFTMLADVQIDDQTFMMACQATTTIIKNRLVYLFSYCHYEDSKALAHLNKLHQDFVDRIFASN